MTASISVSRPMRWDHPLDPSLTPEVIAWLVTEPPFCDMNSATFDCNVPLCDILRNDTRLHKLASGDVLFQKGQYGGSAYIVLRGSMRLLLTDALAADGTKGWSGSGPSLVDSQGPVARSWGGAKNWLQWFSKQPGPSTSGPRPLGVRGTGAGARVFLQDVPGVLDEYESSAVTAGQLFGELAAITRTSRDFTAVAETDCLVLEVRWQGLKLLRQNAEFRLALDQRYRTCMLRAHLCETPLLAHVPDETLDAIVAATQLESFGDMEWYAGFRRDAKEPAAQRIEREPMIASEGSHALGLWILRSGFARLSRRQGAGHKTLAYLGKGQIFGLSELAHNWRESNPQTYLPYQQSLRAIGYVDALCIPKAIVMEHILPFVDAGQMPPRIVTPRYRFGQPVLDTPSGTGDEVLDAGLLEFLVEQRLINGRMAMVIDTQRCTRCDDCVRACASTHHNQPVFERRGPQYGPWLFAQACMHCEDPVCMIGCPTGAIHRSETSGQVQINPHTCIGCRVCADSCPYENIHMQETTDTRGRRRVDEQGLPILQASKCDLCHGAGGKPACVSACPHDALVRMDMSDLKGNQSWLQSKAG